MNYSASQRTWGSWRAARRRSTPAADLPYSPPSWAEGDWKGRVRSAWVNDRRVRYLDAGSGPVVVLIHGLDMFWRVWLPNIHYLARDHRIVAIDLPAFGDSERLRWQRDLNGHAETVVALVRELDALPCTVVGHSLGGLVAQRSALLLRDDLDGLVLVSSPDSHIGLFQRMGIAIALASLRTLLYPRTVERWCIDRAWLRKVVFGGLVVDTTCLDPALLTELLRGYATNGFWRGMHAGLGDPVSTRLAGIQAPALVLNGTEDALIRPSGARRLADAIPNATLEMWDDVGHSPMLEQPDRFNNVLRAFVAEHASGQRAQHTS